MTVDRGVQALVTDRQLVLAIEESRDVSSFTNVKKEVSISSSIQSDLMVPSTVLSGE